jgi:hypothetical protein
MMIDTRAREATRRALLEVEAIELPEAETVIARRLARHRARMVRTSAAVVVLLALISGVAVFAARERSTSDHVAISGPPSTTPSPPAPAGLVLKGFHAQECDKGELFQAVYGCSFGTDSGTSADVAAVSGRDTGTNGWVVDVTLAPTAAARFARDATISASLDGVPVSVARGEHGTLVLARAGSTPWDANAANSVAARIIATR